MKKSLLLLFLAVTALFGFAMSAKQTTVDAAAAGQVVFHYQKWDGVYDNVGVNVWNAGTDGSSGLVSPAGEDDFGAYFEIAIGANATSMGMNVLSDHFDEEWVSDENPGRWGYKDTMDDADIFVDVTAAAAGATMDVYFFSGSDAAFIGSTDNISVFIIYFTASEVYEEHLGIHAWEGWFTDPDLGTWASWGTPTEIFTVDFMTPEGKLGKIGMVEALPAENDAKMLIYAGDNATKKTADVIIDIDALEAGDITAVYVAAEVFMGLDKAALYAESSFAFKFTPFSIIEGVLDGTFAIDSSLIQVKFSAEVTSVFYDPESPITTIYELYEIVGYEYVPTGDDPIVIDTTVYDPYVATDVPAGLGRVVFHYQKWDSDYSDVGLWVWGTGTGGTADGVTRSGVDDFGAVFEVNIGTGGTSMGFIPIADEMGTDSRWSNKDSLNQGDVNFDISGIEAGEVVHVYFFSGVSTATTFVAEPDKANVIFLMINETGVYEENLGVHNWWQVWDVEAASWDAPLLMEECFVSPFGLPGMGIMLTIDPANIASNPGAIVHAGDTKYSGDANIEGIFAGMTGGDVLVVYSGVPGATAGTYAFTLDHDEFVSELMLPVMKGDAIYDYVEYEEITYERTNLDIAAMFTLMKDGVAVADAIESAEFKLDADAINELVLQLAVELEAGHEYTLLFDNGIVGLDNRSSEIELNLDEEGPVITILLDTELTFEAGTAWDESNWPNIRALDDRDGDVTDRIYIKSGEGTVNFGVPAVYPITVTVYDDWGNETQASFNITITEPETGCAAASASIGILGLLGVVFVFVRRREWF